MAMPTTAVTRYELSAPFSEFDEMINRKGFIGPKVLVPRLVGLQAANVGMYPLEVLLQSYKTKRAPGAGYQRGNWEFEQFEYSTSEHGWEEPMDDATLAIYSDMIDAEEVHARRAMEFVLSEYERDVAAAVFDTNVWTGASFTTAVGTPWSTSATAAPIDDVNAAREKVVASSGTEPNALVLNRKNFRFLINCAQIVDRVKYTQRADQQKMALALADILDIQHILVAGGVKNTANDQKDASIARIWPNANAMVCRVAETEDPREPCVGRTFIWSGDGPGALGTGEELALIVEEYRDEPKRANVIRARNNYGLKIQRKEFGHLLSNISA